MTRLPGQGSHGFDYELSNEVNEKVLCVKVPFSEKL